MPASGIFISAIAQIKAAVNALGYKPVTDPRNARPLTIFIEMPTFSGFNTNIADMTFTLRVLAPPPGNEDATNWILTAVDAIHESADIAVTAGTPSIALIGEQQLPAYDLTVRLATRRN